MFQQLSSGRDTEVENVRQEQVVEFNNQFSTYNREDVRGSDLYSLLNRAIDYNKRQSYEGKDGKYIAYTPITITFQMNGQKNQFAADGRNNTLIKNNSYTQAKTTNTFENAIKSEIDRLENKYGSDSLTSLSAGLTKIFVADSASNQEKTIAIQSFNNISKKVSVTDWKELKPGSTIRNDVFKYYEYVQFKRANFKCTNVKYNNQSGRIIEMTFVFTGQIN